MDKLIRIQRRKLFASLVFAVSSMLAFTSYTMWRMHSEALDNGLEMASMQASGFEDFVTQNLHFIELAAVTAAQSYADQNNAMANNTLAASVHNAPFMRSMSLLGADGRVIASSNPANIGKLIETRDFLPGTDDGREILRMGQPWRGRDFASGAPASFALELPANAHAFLPLVRNVRVDNMSYRMVVAINPDYFINYFIQQVDASVGAVTVLRYDGTVLMDSTGTEAPGTKLEGLVRQLDLQEGIGKKFDGSAAHYAPALNAFRSSSQYPVLILVRLDREYALRHWRTEVRTLMIVVSLALALVCLLAIGSFRRRLQIAVERERFERQQSVHASVFTHAREAILITTPDGTIVDINASFTRITGYNAEDVIGHKPSILSSGRHDRAFYEKMWNELIGQGHWHGEIWNRRKNGVIYPEMLTIGAVRNSVGSITQFVALFSDITRAKEHEQELEHIAHYDALTNLPNRVLLADRLRQGILQSQRRGTRLAVAFIDLDGFKQVNDEYGHEAGDALLVELSGRMKKALRGGDTLARLGGDEFVAVLLDLPDNGSSLPMLSRLLKAVSQPFEFGEARLKVSGSLGVTFYPQTEDVDADTLLRQADQAMYQAKLAGKDRYHVFDAALDRDLRSQHESVERMRRALLDNEFVLHYQPKVNLGSGAIVGAEALIRWQHPERGMLPPAEFLPLIEDHPLAVDIGEWVLATALHQSVEWRKAGLPLPISVNIGARQLQQGDFVSRLCDILGAEPNAEPGDIELEILETSAIQDLARISQVIEACQRLGVPFALDDFGTGYSSLTYLKRLPVSVLKIDQSFVRGMLDDPDDLAILEGVVGLAKSFHRDVIAEGVETAEHSEMLLRLGCKLAQGYGIARPMPAGDMPAWAESWRSEGVWLDLPTVSRRDVPLLFASVEHRAWVKAIERRLMDQSPDVPSLDPRHCRFGHWLNTEGIQRYGDCEEMQAILQLHVDLHTLAHRLVSMHLADDKDAARAGLVELRALHDALLSYIRRLLHKHFNPDAQLMEDEMAAPAAANADAVIDGSTDGSMVAGPDAKSVEGMRQFD